MANKASYICQWQEHGTSHREKLRQLRRKPILVEGIVGAGLNEKIREAEDARDIDMFHVAEIDRNFARPFFIRTKERTIILPRAHEGSGNSFAGEDCRREIKTANFPRIGRVNVACVTENNIFRRHAETRQKGLVLFFARKKALCPLPARE